MVNDLIKLLPDSVANQIAAGEVVQRPASAVKELLENAVDAGATDIRVIIREAGKSLIQVIDNGCGMSERDARMCFERHATSKISSANDLLTIRTLGFRGEAIASIASVAQVELKSRQIGDEIGTLVRVEGSDFKSQAPVSCPEGTSVAVRNLFFNVPARRNFLKSNTLELKYILEEFYRVALVNPEIAFTFTNNDKVLHQLPGANTRQRIVALFGNAFNQRLVPVEQSSSIVDVRGFIGKPEFAKKTRGEQYFFTNGRFIKNAYLHHAVENAFQELIPKDAFPTYFLYLATDPKTIDVNIHPTKTEINFQDVRSIYAILHSAVRQAIGKFTLSPSLDFDQEHSLDMPAFPKDTPIRPPSITVDPSFNPFEKKTRPQMEIPLPSSRRAPDANWQQLYEPLKEISFPAEQGMPGPVVRRGILQVMRNYLVTETRQGVILIDIARARERIRYEQLLPETPEEPVPSQKLLLPQTYTVNPAQSEILKEYREELRNLGFEVSEFGKNTWLIGAVPSGTGNEDPIGMVESLLETLQSHPGDPEQEKRARMAASLSRSLAAKDQDRLLQLPEMEKIVEQLFACRVPDLTPDGKPVLHILGDEELARIFK